MTMPSGRQRIAFYCTCAEYQYQTCDFENAASKYVWKLNNERLSISKKQYCCSRLHLTSMLYIGMFFSIEIKLSRQIKAQTDSQIKQYSLYVRLTFCLVSIHCIEGFDGYVHFYNNNSFRNLDYFTFHMLVIVNMNNFSKETIDLFLSSLFLLYGFNYLNIVYLNMRIIINEALKKYNDRNVVDRSQLQKFIESHSFFSSYMDVEGIIQRIQNSHKKKHQVGSRSQSKQKQYQKDESLDQLALYLNRDNNKQIFVLFESILTHPKGIAYEALSKKLKTDIITVSHYCCKLKKLRLIQWQHQKDGILVRPKTTEHLKQEREIKYMKSQNEGSFDIKDSFLFTELGMNQNIWINISSEESLARGGLTNEEIKRKIMKHAENKMVRRTVESMKYFQRNAQRQGKVFEFKYKNQTEQIKAEIIRSNQLQEELQALDEEVLEWLQVKFPEFEGESFLLDLVNSKFKDYISSLGVKQSKRQCTPLKLNRYIKALNYLNRQGGMRESELRGLIVKDQARFNIGIMHKRSLMGILEGLKNLQIVLEDDGFYFPAWVSEDRKMKKKEVIVQPKKEYQVEATPKKRNHVERAEKEKGENNKGKDANGGKFKRISQKKYRLQLFVALLAVTLDKSVKKIFRKAFNRIVYVQRKKGSLKYTPQTNVLYLLQENQQTSQCLMDYTQTVQSFYKSLDMFIEGKGKREQHILQAENQLVKFLRKNPIKNSNSLRIKYGKNWKSKLQELISEQVVEVDGEEVRVVDEQALLI